MRTTAAIIFLSVGSSTAFGLEFESGGKWLGSIDDMPAKVSATLRNCPAIKGHYLDSEAAFVVDLGSGAKLYFAACDLGANSNDAAVLHRGGKATRLSFSYVDDNGKMVREKTAANVIWKNPDRLSSRASTGCVGETGVKLSYRFDGSAFVLLRQEENDNCDKPDWTTVYEAP